MDKENQLSEAIEAAFDKNAQDAVVIELGDICSFTDYFLICSGTNPRQIQAISDEIELRLKRAGVYPNSIEGYKQAEWVLIDYVDFVVHIFSEASRRYYDLERLWKSAKKLEPAELAAKPRRRAAPRTTAKKRA